MNRSLIHRSLIRRSLFLGASWLVAAIFGGAAVSGLQAQSTAPGAGAYAVIEVGEITDQRAFAALLPRAGTVSEAFGGRTLIDTAAIVGRDALPPRRFVVIAFAGMEDAEAWSRSAAQAEIDRLREASSEGRSFLVDGGAN